MVRKLVISMNNKLIVGLSGNASVGKDTLYKYIDSSFKSYTALKTERIALADPLKEQTREEILKRFNIDILNCSPAEKEIARPYLVSYALEKRISSQGKYWTSIAQDKIAQSEADIIVITDVRYDYYPEDEANWLLCKNNGFLIHISRYSFLDGHRVYVGPANKHEAENNPKLKSKSNLSFEWEFQNIEDDLIEYIFTTINNEYKYKN